MDILLISNEDQCRSRMAQALLESFGRGMQIFTAGIAEGSSVPTVVSEFMMQKGYEISRKKPAPVGNFTTQEWGCVISLCREAEDELNSLNLKTENVKHFCFDDPLQDMSMDEEELQLQLSAVYDDMNRQLYEFYRDTLSELLMPRCTCGANTFCRCE